jgi:hypothetical protein
MRKHGRIVMRTIQHLIKKDPSYNKEILERVVIALQQIPFLDPEYEKKIAEQMRKDCSAK